MTSCSALPLLCPLLWPLLDEDGEVLETELVVCGRTGGECSGDIRGDGCKPKVWWCDPLSGDVVEVCGDEVASGPDPADETTDQYGGGGEDKWVGGGGGGCTAGLNLVVPEISWLRSSKSWGYLASGADCCCLACSMPLKSNL